MTTAIFKCELIHSGTQEIMGKTMVQVPMGKTTEQQETSAKIAMDTAFARFWRKNPKISQMTHNVTTQLMDVE